MVVFEAVPLGLVGNVMLGGGVDHNEVLVSLGSISVAILGSHGVLSGLFQVVTLVRY